MAVRSIDRRQRQVIREQLRSQPLFSECSDDELDLVDTLLAQVPTSRDEIVLAEGASDRQFVILVDGWLQVSRAGGDIGLLGPGEFVGELAMLFDEPRSATVTALTPGTIWVVGRGEFDRLARIPSVGRRLHAAAERRREAIVAGPSPALVSTAPARPAGAMPAAVAPVRLGTRTRRRWARRMGLASTVVLVVVAVAGAWVAANRDKATEVTLTDALEELATEPEAAVEAPAGVAASPVDAPASGAAAASPAPSSAAQSGGTRTAPAPAGETRAEPPSDAAAAAAAPRFVRPVPGVYSYATSGREEISILGAHHEYPAETYSIVRPGEGCAWTVEHRVLEEHVDHFNRCSASGQFLDLGHGSVIEFFEKRDGLMYTCNPPSLLLAAGDPAGTRHSGTCTSEDGDRSDVTATYVGQEPLDIGGSTVRAEHLRLDITMSGRADGRATADFWLHPETGLTLRLVRDVDTLGDAAFGDVRYTEHAEFQLVSLTPAEG